PGVGGFFTTTFCTVGRSAPTTTSIVEPSPGFSTRVDPGIEAATVRVESSQAGSYRTTVVANFDDSASATPITLNPCFCSWSATLVAAPSVVEPFSTRTLISDGCLSNGLPSTSVGFGAGGG